jgi:hypothetical protein
VNITEAILPTMMSISIAPMGEINMIFGGSIFITLKTQGKKLEREISLAQCIESVRMMRWSDVDISFGP